MQSLEKFLNTLAIVYIGIVILVTVVIQSNNTNNDPLLIEPEFTSYFNDFKKDADKHQVTPLYSNLTTTFINDIKGDVLAYCIPKLNIVRVSRKRWNAMEGTSRKLLLYHEWAHCTLKRDHVDEFEIGVSCPSSIMYPYIDPMINCYTYNKDWYDFELFKNPNNRATLP